MFNPDNVKPIEWQEPEPLYSDDVKRVPYPVDILPEGFKQAVLDVQAITQAPMAMVSTCAITA
jgi:putative DNA primase/helicase